MKTDNIVHKIDFNNPTEFLDMLSPRSKLWYPNPDLWIFRGQRDAEWELIPSAFRPNSWSQFEGLFGGILSEKSCGNELRLQLELNIVWWFAKAADRQGLRVPSFDHSWLNSNELNQKFQDISYVFSNNKTFPLPEWGPLFGMAQHYGIPTRLLDWTESAFIASYFAASEAAKVIKEKAENIGEKIVVWALRTDILEKISIQSEEEIHIVRAPWESNPNLQAQKGLFTLHHIRQDPDEEFIPVSLEKAIRILIGKSKIKKLPEPVMYCLRLHINQSPTLLSQLYQEGVNAASIFPGYGGITKSIKELRLCGPTN